MTIEELTFSIAVAGTAAFAGAAVLCVAEPKVDPFGAVVTLRRARLVRDSKMEFIKARRKK